MKFMNGLASFVGSLDAPAELKVMVETLGFGHLHLDVTIPRVIIFRDAILDLFAVELSARFSRDARQGKCGRGGGTPVASPTGSVCM